MTEPDNANNGQAPAGLRRWAEAPFDFERPEARLGATLILFVAAVVSPYLRIPQPLPAIRLEQLLLLVFLYPLFRYLARHPEARRLGPLDLAFVALPAAILLSVVFAPIIVPEVGRSIRDLFSLLWPVQYWLLFRIALTCVPSDRTARATLLTLWGVSLVSGLIVLVQYLGPSGYNQHVTSFWASGHDLSGVIFDGRVVATLTNADAFAIVAGLFALSALWALLLRVRLGHVAAVVVVVALGTGLVGFVLAQSRAGAIAILGGTVLGLLLVLLFRRPARWIFPALLVVVFMAGSVGLLEWAPSRTHTVGQRFDVTTVSSDPSVVLRLARIRLLFATATESPDTGGLCAGRSPAPPSPGHEPAARAAGPATSTPGSAVTARDAQRKRDVAAIGAALDRFYCATGRWPASNGSLATDLGGYGLASLPKDPSTGSGYTIELDPKGYLVSARIEDPADPDGPVYAVSSRPNYVLNPSFESSPTAATSWLTDGRSRAVIGTDSRFAAQAADVTLAARGYFQQYVVHTLNANASFSASVWLRSTSGQAATVTFNSKEVLQDGSYINHYASQATTLPADGSWVRATTAFTTPNEGLVYIVQFLIQNTQTTPVEITVDGGSVTATPVAPAFATVRDVDPAQLATSVPSFYRSPVVGLGPLKVLLIGGDPGEYILVLVRYGILGELGYLALFLAAFLAAFQAWRKTHGARSALALSMLTFTVMGAAFAVTAPAYFNYQLMDLYWPLVGVVTAMARAPRAMLVEDAGPGIGGAAAREPGTPGGPRDPGEPAPMAAASVARR